VQAADAAFGVPVGADGNSALLQQASSDSSSSSGAQAERKAASMPATPQRQRVGADTLAVASCMATLAITAWHPTRLNVMMQLSASIRWITALFSVQSATQQQWATPATAPPQQRPPTQHVLQGLLLEATPASSPDGRGTDSRRNGGRSGGGGGDIPSQLAAGCRLDGQPRIHSQVPCCRV
jgi:hypothetical protein